MLRRADEFAERLHEVPLHLVVCAKLGDLAIVDAGLERPSIVGGASIYPFVQNMLLGFRSEGLGCALTTILAPAEAEVRQLLAIPEDVVIAAYVVVGHRADPWPKRLSRHPVEVRLRRSLRRAPRLSVCRREASKHSEVYSAGGTGTALKAVVPAATFRPRPVALLA